MTLQAGSRLGPYEILSPLGAGGMGEVYRAKDPRLGRDVAIKVLPASFSTDPDRLKRFEQGETLALSPDGQWVLAAVVRNAPRPLVLLPTGAGEPRPFPKDTINHNSIPATFSGDGKRIVFVGSEAGHDRRTWIQDVDGGKARPVTPEGVIGTTLSPDGRLVAARGADQKMALYRVDGGPPQPVGGFEPNDLPLSWSSDQKYIYASGNAGTVQTLTARVFRIEVETGRREIWKEFSLPDPTGVSGINARAITPDERTSCLPTRSDSRSSTWSRA